MTITTRYVSARITDVLILNSYSYITKIDWEVSDRIDFSNIIASLYGDESNTLEYKVKLDKDYDINSIYVRARIYSNGVVSDWISLRPDFSRNVRIYDDNVFLREKIYDRNGELVIVSDYADNDNPIDLYKYPNVIKEYFEFLDIGDKVDFIVGTKHNVMMLDNYVNVTPDNLKLNTGNIDGAIFGSGFTYLPYIKNKTYSEILLDLNITNGYFVYSVKLIEELFGMVISIRDGKVDLFGFVGNSEDGVLIKDITDEVQNDKLILGIRKYNRYFSIYVNHKRVKTYLVDDVNDFRLMAYLVPISEYDNEVTIRYIKTYDIG